MFIVTSVIKFAVAGLNPRLLMNVNKLLKNGPSVHIALNVYRKKLKDGIIMTKQFIEERIKFHEEKLRNDPDDFGSYHQYALEAYYRMLQDLQLKECD